MDGYDEKVHERISRIPNGKAGYGFIRPLRETSPWAKSVIITAAPLTHYNIPQGTYRHFGKYYLVDYRVGESLEMKALQEFGKYLSELYQVSDDVKGFRWAAQAAGLGIIRRNNFFYAEDGAYYSLKAWAVDAELDEYIHERDIPPCPENCDRCIKACPTGALSAAYTMNIHECISRLTTSGGISLETDDPRNAQIGRWVYGCDACTDCCPHNAQKWRGGSDFPGLEEVTKYLEPIAILRLTYEQIAQILMPRYFYLRENDLWKWKINALNALANDWNQAYAGDVEAALSDSDARVCAKAEQVLNSQKKI
jgi:epoxyqueuosine reductase